MSGQFENEVIPVTGAVRGQGGAHTARFIEKHHVATNSTGESGETRLDRSFFQDPHSFYRRLRDAAPATRVRMWGDVPVWLITQYDEARTLLSDSRLSKDFHGALALFPPGGAGAHGSLFNKCCGGYDSAHSGDSRRAP
jgi:cytochrome P450